MAAPVWKLSVDLETKTASFQTGMADAAKTARGSFKEIEQGALGMSESTRGSMTDAREGVMLLGEQFGIHLPRALTTFLAELGPVAGAIEAAFPFIAVAALAGILIEHLVKLHEAGLKLTEDQEKFGTAAQSAFNDLDKKLLQAGITADELSNNHLDAVQKKLQLIDMQSMEELAHTFATLQKAADTVFKDLEAHWYSLGNGSQGAKHALDSFQASYESLLAKGKGKDASDLLTGTLSSAKESLAKLEEAQVASDKLMAQANIIQRAAMLPGLKEQEIARKDALESQKLLVQTLEDQVAAQSKVNASTSLEKKNVVHKDNNDQSAKRAAAAKEAVESELRIKQQGLAADKSASEASSSISRASVEEKLATSIQFAGRDRDIKLSANQQEIADLDKSGKDYSGQLKALQDKALEITADYNAKVVELKSKASVEEYNRDLQALQQSEQEKIEATREGSAARLAALDQAIAQEEAQGLEGTQHYKELLNQRISTARKEAEEEAKLTQDAAKESASNSAKMGQLSIEAEKQKMALTNSARRTTAAQMVAEESLVANQEYAIKMAAMQKEIEGLDKSGKDYVNKLVALQNQEKQLTQAHENELVSITEKAEMERNQRVLAANSSFNNSLSASLTQVMMRYQSFGMMLTNIGNQVVSGMMKNAVQSALADDFTKERDAAAAARKAYLSGASIGGPAGLVLGPVMAAAAFAQVMAFNQGTDYVPGVGNSDTVPTMLTPGEGVVPGGVMDGLRNMVKNGGMDKHQSHTTVHVSPTYHVNTIDGDGMQDALSKHSEQINQHVTNHARKLNK